MRRFYFFVAMLACMASSAQISSFPDTEGFEIAFTEGTDVEFITNWTGNTVASSNRIFQSGDARTGSNALAIQPISSFDGEVLIAIDLTGFENCQIDFYAKSNQNGSGDRAALVYFSMSTDGGMNFDTPTQIGDNTTFPNTSGESYAAYSYSLDASSDNQANVVVKLLVERNESGTGSAAEFVMDDVVISADATVDTDPPTILSATAVSDTEVDVQFSEDLNPALAESASNYAIDGMVTVTDATLDTDNSLVHLTTSTLTNGETYTLTVNNLQDTNGNTIVADSEESFEYLVFEEGVAFDVVINEFMAAPGSESGVPDAEYVELYNRSTKFINLEDWTISDAAGSSSAFSATTLKPDEYLILTSTGNGTLFNSYGDVLEVSGFPALNNGGDDITVTNSLAADIHSITYASSTPQISTELINPNGPDYSENNYGLSTDPDGGTPGAQNSIFDDTPDTTAPVIASISVISQTALDVAFDESLEETSAETIGNYAIDGGIAVTAAMLDDSDDQLVHLTVDPLVSGEERILTINDVEDLSGNPTVNASGPFEYLEVQEAEAGDVIINEFLSNPTNNNDDFIELLNVSDKYIDMAGWSVSDESDTSEDLPSFILRPGAYLIIYDEDATIDYSASGDALTIASLTLNNADDQVEITSATDVQIDFLAYEEEQDDGVSLELINPTDPCRLLKNYLPSTDPSGSTPGVQNSIFDDELFDTTAPAIATISVVSNTALDVAFDEALDETSAETIGNYSIDGSISVVSVTLDVTDNQLVHLMVDPLVSEEVRTLTVNGVEDLCGNQTADETIQFEYIETQEAVAGDVIINEFLSNPVDNNDDFIELYNVSDKFIDMAGWNIKDELSTSEDLPSFIIRPGAFLIIYDEDATIDYSSFGDALTIASLTLNNADDQIEIISGTDVQVDFLAYQEEQEDGISLELTNPNDPCRSLGSYAASIDPSGSTPGAQNSVFDDTPDTNPPTIQSYNFDTKLTINFSEAMDPASLTSGTYLSSGALTINEVLTTGLFPTSVEISFNESIELGVSYELTIADVTDCPGNSIVETTITFGRGRSPGFNELIITELMSDPDPQVELPNREFIEVYNATADIISTVGINLTDASSTVELTTRTLNPGEYYVLTTTAGASEFASNAIGVPSFPSLNNGGEPLTLSLAENLIFSLTYDPGWHEEEKADGGYSLEMIDVTNPCLEDGSNWTSSQDSRGGTPGEANSISEVIPDNFGPEILVATAVSSDSIRVDFTEKIDPSSQVIATASLSPSIAVDGIFFDFLHPSTLIITLNEDLQESVPYTLSITGVVDCAGNEIQDSEVAFALPVRAEANEIKLSEVLFNPRSNGVDFVEVYNTSEKYISLKEWKLATLDDEGEVDDEDLITADELVIAPGQYLALTTDADILLSNYPKGQSAYFFEMSALPSYPNDEGTVLLIDQSDEIKESFEYTEDYHYNLLESIDGVSLERVSFAEATNSGDNWRSAASTEGFATPGYTNSQSFVNTTPIGRVTASPEVFIPGNLGSGRDFTTINYSFDQPGQFANVNIYDQTGRLVKNLAQGVLLSTSGFLRWDGDTNGGNVARMGYYLIIFEIYDSSGNSETIKETVVVGRDF